MRGALPFPIRILGLDLLARGVRFLLLFEYIGYFGRHMLPSTWRNVHFSPKDTHLRANIVFPGQGKYYTKLRQIDEGRHVGRRRKRQFYNNSTIRFK